MTTPKQRYFDRVYAEAEIIECACGCGAKIKNKDRYARDVRFVSGHNRRKYDDPGQHKREWNHRNRGSRYALKVSYARKRKIALIRMKNSECLHCKLAYNGKNGSLFHLHHRDPAFKSFRLNQQTLISTSWEAILLEAAKCDLLCANCHALHHCEEF